MVKRCPIRNTSAQGSGISDVDVCPAALSESRNARLFFTWLASVAELCFCRLLRGTDALHACSGALSDGVVGRPAWCRSSLFEQAKARQIGISVKQNHPRAVPNPSLQAKEDKAPPIEAQIPKTTQIINDFKISKQPRPFGTK